MKEAYEPHLLNGDANFALDDVTGQDCLHPANGRHGVSYATQMLAHWFDHALELWRRTIVAQPARYRRRRKVFEETRFQPLHTANSQRQPARCYGFKELWSKRQGLHPIDWCSPGVGGGSGGSGGSGGGGGGGGGGGDVGGAVSCASWGRDLDGEARKQCPKSLLPWEEKSSANEAKQQRSDEAYAALVAAPPAAPQVRSGAPPRSLKAAPRRLPGGSRLASAGRAVSHSNCTLWFHRPRGSGAASR